MIKSLHARFVLLFVTFVLLVLVSVGAMEWGLQTEQQDALTINLAGRQRMLSQQMARLAFESGKGEDTNNAALQDAEGTFDQTLRALLHGGTVAYQPEKNVTLSATQDPQIIASLNQVNATWSQYRALLDRLQNTSQDDPSFPQILQSIEQISGTLAGQADAAVRLYEAALTAKVSRLRAFQIGFLMAALILLGIGALINRRYVLDPLKELSRAAARVGGNDLDTPVIVSGPEEMDALAKSFDAMRINLRSSRQELIQLNETLEARVTQRTRELEMLNEVSREISSRLNIQHVLNSVTDKTRMLLGGEVASLCLIDQNRHWLKLQALSGPRDAIAEEVAPADESLAAVVLESNEALICGTAASHGRCRMLTEEYRASHMAAPLRIGERVIGALCVGNSAQDCFAGDTAGMLTKLANAAAVALENAHLYEQAERVATMEERRRMAAEMHDGLGQTLGYLGLITDQVVKLLSVGKDEAALERLETTRRTIERASGDVRRAINALMDDSPTEIKLCDRLKAAVDECALENNLPITWQAESVLDCPLQVMDQVLNFTREALKNVVNHAQASRVNVRVGSSDGYSFIEVKDDGIGFDLSQPRPSGHFGLQIMEARAAHIGGKLEIDSRPGQGTRITLRWPALLGD